MNYRSTYSFTRMSFLFFWIAFLLAFHNVSAQAPGGITTGLNLWLDASNGTTATGSNLTNWTDKTAINTFTVSATPPTVTVNAVNFHSTVDFNNTTATDVYPAEQSLIGDTPINYTDAYAVFKVNDGNGGVIVGGTIPGTSYGKAVFAEFNSSMHSGNGDPTTYSNFSFTDFENYHVFGMDAGLAGNLIGRMDGADQSVTNSIGFSSISLIPTIGTTNNNGNLAGWNHLNGQVAEVILYNQTTAGQRINIESYLALKYGIHKAGNYVNSSNTVLWNAIANSVYHNDVFGLGQDNGSGLIQAQSNSMNTGSGDGTGQSGKGNIVISNPSALVDGSFLILGHDTADLLLSTTNIPAGNPNLSRVNRSWKVSATNNLGTVTLQFDANSLTYSSVNSSGSYLLIDTDGDGDFTTGTVDQILGTKSGSIYQFDNVTLPNNAVFTFATDIVSGPGSITGNLRLWLKANSSVTPATQGAAVTAWGDQSGGGNNASLGVLTPTPINPTYQLNALNFNPIVRFSGTSATNYSVLAGIISPAITSNNISVYSVLLMNGTSSASGRAVMIAQNAASSDWQNQAGASIVNRLASNITSYRNSTQGPATGPVLGSTVITSTHFTAGNAWRTEMNGNAFTSTTYTTAAFNSGYYRLGLSTVSANDWFNGDIAEVLMYDADQSSLSGHNQIESYLALKYGIHKVGSYVNSSNTTIWDATANAAYHNDVFGIGQDDTTSLLQVQSNSLNTGSGDGTGQSAKGNIVISNPSSLANNGFLIIGHDIGLLTEANVSIAGNLTKRVQRIWKAQSTGNPGTVTLNYDKTGLTYSAVIASDYVLLVDPTGTANFSGGTVVKYPAAAITGNKITFNTVALPTGAVFTFQTSFTPVFPTVQATNVTFTGTTETSTTVNWTNGNGASRAVFMFAGVTGSPVPVDNTTYTANTVFGTGTQVGTTGWYCIYNGTGTNVTITGLTPATNYRVMAVEYNGLPGGEEYLSTVSTGNPATLATTSTTGPGGITANLRLWLKANSSVTPATQGASVTSWNDQSGGNNATIPILTPAVVNPTYQLNSINFNPTVRFSGTSNTSFSALGGTISPPITSNNITAIAVVLMNSATSPSGRTLIISQNDSSSELGNQNGASLINRINSNVTGSRNNVQGATSLSAILDTPAIINSNFKTDNTWNILLNGNAGPSVAYPLSAFNAGYYRLGLGTASNNDWFNGDIAEVILYDANQSGVASFVQIQSYLALKYGIQKPSSYVSSSGATIWDGVANFTYRIDAFGIGRDDATGLLQVQSNSANSGSGDGTGQSGKGNLVISNPSSLVNNGFLIIGNNAGALTETDVVFGGSTTKRVQRVWKAQTTGTPGTITLSYDITGLTYSGQSASDYALLVDPTGAGVFTGGTVVKYAATSITSNKVIFNTVNLPTGALFTIQTLSTPTIQATNVNFATTTGTTTTASWTNGNGTSRAVFMYAGASGSPLPTDNITYTPNTAFGTGTQIGTTGWYCVYNGTGTTVDITGLNPATTYQLMTVEYNGTAGHELYLTTISTGNPAAVTTLSNIATLSNLSISQGTLNPVFVSGTTSYTATVPNAITTLTLTPTTTDVNATVTVNGVAVTSGSPSGAIALAVGSNVITTIVTAQDGTTIETYTVTVTRTEPTIITTGTLSALTTIYGTPSASGTFNVSGADMAAGILVTAPSGFEVSTDNTTFTNTVTVGAAGIIVSTPVYIRLKGTVPVGSYSGDIVLTSSNATTVNVSTVSSTVTPAPLTITADNQGKIYGDANPTLTISYSGFVNGDVVASLTTLPSSATTAVTGSPVGTYPITVSGAANSNYTISYVAGTLTVSPVTLTITANNVSKSYGSANPTLTASYSGFVNGDTAASLTTLPTITTTAVTASAVGSYPIVASGAVDANYIISYVNGSLTITAVTLTVTAADKTKVYGDANPTLTATYTGFVNGETEADLLTPATISTTAVTASAVGTYPIVAVGAADPNYTFNYVDGILTVTKAVLTVTADAQTKVYGSANPSFTASYSGFVNGETEADLLTPATISTTAVTASAVGTYPIVAVGAADPNYTFNYVDGILTVTKAVLTVTADAQTKVYGSANPSFTASYSGFVNGDTAASLTTLPTITTTAVTASAVGTYPIVASDAVDANYIISYVNGSLTITAVTLTVTAADKTKVYGDANPTLTATYTGFVNGETEADLLTLATISTTAVTASAVGTYPIVAVGAADPNYTFNYVDGILTVTKAVLTVTADAQTKVYGSANPTLTATYTGFANGETVASLLTPATISTTAATASAVGTYPIVAVGAADPNYTFNYVDGILTVTKAVLTVTADAQTKVYGSANPTLTATYTGFANGDTSADLTTQASLTTTGLTGSPVGTYPITASGAVSANYTFTYVAGTLTVTPVTLTITANNQSKVYGDANPTLTASYSGFVNGDTAADLTTQATVTTTGLTGSPVGTYPITASGATSANYTFSYVAGTLTVTKAMITITADDKAKAYGTANPTLTATYLGFVNGENETDLTTLATITTTADLTSIVGTYPITASGAVSSNYDFTYVNGTLTVTSGAILTITVNNQTKIYGEVNPAFTVSYSGFVNGDTEANLTTLPTVSTSAVQSSPVGTYTTIASGASATNYTITYVNGTLNVIPANLTVTADNQSKIYGSAIPTLTTSYTGFVNGDTAASLSTPPTISTTATNASDVGTYPITASGAVDTNYTISYLAGNLTVTTATLTITANDQSKTYGSANPTLTASYTGFVNGDTAASLTTAPTISTTATNASIVGTYPITASGAVDTNYTISYVAGNLTVTTAPLTITANDQSKIYGSAIPTLTTSYTGFVNGDTAASLTTLPTILTTATIASIVGTYPITASGAVDPNYTISYLAGNLTVTTATLTITANDQSKTYGSANPTLTASYTGFVNGDTAASLTTAPTISTTATNASIVGTYPITASGAVDTNYTISYIAGNLTVTAATLTITANDQSKIYGSANPTLTTSYTGFVNGDTAASLSTPPTISTTATSASIVGTYPITASGAVDSNYTISYVAGNLTVTTATLTITANDQSKIYGSAIPTLTTSYTGFVNGDTAASLSTQPTISTTATSASIVGAYPITASGAVDPNYTISYVAGNLTVTTAPLTITANDQSKIYGSAIPTLTTSYTGFVNGDTAASLSTQPTISTTATTASNVGTYPITASGAVDSNYTISYVAGNLTVTTAPLTITANDQSKTYGSANPTLTASYTGFVNGDTAASLTTLPIISTTATNASIVGTYPITASGAVDSNYTISYVAGSLSVTTATLTITANDQSKVYGDLNPLLTITYAGFVNGDTATSLTTQATATTTAITGSSVGTYPITASGATSANYTFTYVNGNLEVTKAMLTITADDKAKDYGTINPALTATYLGFVNGDTQASLTTAPTIATSANLASVVGTYPITVNGAASSNYDFTYVNGTLTVTSGAILTITVNNQSKIYGEVNPAFTVTYSGFINGDTEANLTTLPTVTTTAVQSSPVGVYTTEASGASATNYTITYVNGTLNVTPANLAIAADNKSKIYGSANPTLTVNYTGFVNGDTESSLTTPALASTTADATSPVGTYPITISGATSANYTIGYTSGAILTVTPANLAIAADNKSKIYGSANPTLTVNYTGFVNGDTESSLTTPAVATTIADATSSVGTYPITVSGATSANYTIGYTSGAILTVTPANLAIAADDKSKIYGSANPTLTVNYTGFVNGDTESSLTTPAVASTTADATSPVGTYPITISGATSANYTIGYTSGAILTVTPANLSIAANDQSKTYGSANPVLTASYTGFVNGDTAASLTTAPTISTLATNTSNVGTYPITASGAVDSNYTIAYVAGNLTVTTATLTITANDQSKTYGSANPTLTASYTGFVNGDTAASLATAPIILTTATTASNVGSYPITASGAVDSNYTISYVAGNLTITTAILTITADDQSKTYGSANPTLTASYTGFVNGDTEASLATPPTISTTATNASNVGSYPITASGAVDSNYTISYVAGNLTVTTATLTITANDQSKTYGLANPTLTASYTGFVNGDTEASLTTAPTISTTAVTASNVGIYPITASGAVDSNYTIAYVAGNLTVTTATLTITANDQSKTYGSANPVLTASYTGFVNGDTEASLTTAPTISTTATNTSNVGTYPITPSGAVDPNYTIAYVAGNLTITTAILTITADDQSKTYGSANPTLTASYIGFVNGDTEASLTTAPTISTTATNASDVGTYPITASGAADSNYTIAYVAGNLTVTTATLTITADDQSKTYGSANPTLTASYTGFVNGDTEASLTTAPIISTTATNTSNVGSYPITASGAVDSNYTISYVAGNLTVTTATLTITADDQSKTYGSANPTLTASYTGFVNGDTAASLTTAPTISTTATNTSNVGTYPITASGAVDSNYTISYVAGNLTVTTTILTITADDKTKTYGSANPTLTVTYEGFVNGDTAASLTTQPMILTTATTTSNVGTYPITASDAVDSNYTFSYVEGLLTITPSTTDVNLASLSVNTGLLTPAFSPDILNYSVNIGKDIHTETITVASENPLDKITINGVVILNGGSLTPASLVKGINTMIIKVTSPDGLVTKTYTLNIIKEGSDIATLSNLSISNGVLEPEFESDVKDYNTVVKYDVNSITLTPIVTDINATITVNGVAVNNATASTPIILNPGENIIKTIVTAEDGITKETYTIIVYKGVPPDKVTATNVLSPNGDGKNDFWEIKDILLYPNNTVTVYDRAGRIVYSKKSYSNDWGGLFNGSPLNNDTYYYLIDLGDALPKIKGFITIIRD